MVKKLSVYQHKISMMADPLKLLKKLKNNKIPTKSSG